MPLDLILLFKKGTHRGVDYAGLAASTSTARESDWKLANTKPSSRPTYIPNVCDFSRNYEFKEERPTKHLARAYCAWQIFEVNDLI